MRRRLHLAPLTFVPTVADTSLSDALRAELQGILAWAIEGCLGWQMQGLAPPQILLDASASDYLQRALSQQSHIDQLCFVAISATSARRLISLSGRSSGFRLCKCSSGRLPSDSATATASHRPLCPRLPVAWRTRKVAQQCRIEDRSRTGPWPSPGSCPRRASSLGRISYWIVVSSV